MLETVEISQCDHCISIAQSDSKGVVISQVSVPTKEWDQLLASTTEQLKHKADFLDLMCLITAQRVLLETS
ncbi:hypothetical protein HWB51_gp065 [Mycobacterium phage Cuke]|uniref:Uncharacterized protein n=1 Tax=Mycobacterium phage Cuke TaxID=2079417 RepID=A0A2L1IX40_9CAUD|nr:hypothetical protein HWB51_gp065 [Mycobacterium phage Cuke]AVD99683.1 hypothetical protein SEA_CUKE_65 [Mycobacterium phage Cuke]